MPHLWTHFPAQKNGYRLVLTDYCYNIAVGHIPDSHNLADMSGI